MKNKIIYWLPRIFNIAYVIFLSIFALDVFGQYSGQELLLALFMHLLPALILLALTIIAWKRELFGVILFIVVGVGYILLAGFDKPWSWYAFISGPAFLLAALYFAGWRNKRRNINL
ncbi:hypothetical protein KGQ24_04040 [Patescibacteria group bacterium]|nr:hypothetical protein [Patescibacteria group bacterium]